MPSVSVLIVEDDPIASTLLAGWARHLGWNATTVSSTTEADAVLATELFDLVVSDVHLPGNDDLRWIENILERDQPPPVILITGNPELTTTLRAANLPVAGYLVKPPDLNALTALAQRLVVDHHRRKDLRFLSREAAWLLTTPEYREGSDDPLRAKLLQLSQCLAAEAARSPRAPLSVGSDDTWRSAITETITVLEKTKNSFRSKELGTLRQRLQQLVRSGASPRAAA